MHSKIFVALLLNFSVLNYVESNIVLGTGSKIIGGEPAAYYQFPWQVSLKYTDLQSGWVGHNCGGVILNQEWVISAAHCFAFTGMGYYEIYAGKHNLSITEEYEQIRSIKVTIIHPDYNPLIVGPYDIALLRADAPFQFNIAIRSINLPKATNSTPCGTAIISGWGSLSTTNTPEMPDIIHFTYVPILAQETCFEVLEGTKYHVTNFCTGPLTGNYGTCVGDNGGGVIHKTKIGKYELIGVTSWGFFPCGQKYSPSVHESISYFKEWIKFTMENF